MRPTGNLRLCDNSQLERPAPTTKTRQARIMLVIRKQQAPPATLDGPTTERPVFLVFKLLKFVRLA